MRIRGLVSFLAAVLISGFVSFSAQAEVFSGKDFLTWERKNQSFYIHTSIGMAALVVGQTSEKQAECIDAWYFDDEENGINFILETMRQYPEYHPRGIILSVMEKQCGRFIYKQ